MRLVGDHESVTIAKGAESGPAYNAAASLTCAIALILADYGIYRQVHV